METRYRWQRARIVKSIGHPEFYRRELWVRIGSRGDYRAHDHDTGAKKQSVAFITNIVVEGNPHPMVIDAERLEMLLRPDEKNPEKPSLDLAEAVGMVRFEDWVKG